MTPTTPNNLSPGELAVLIMDRSSNKEKVEGSICLIINSPPSIPDFPWLTSDPHSSDPTKWLLIAIPNHGHHYAMKRWLLSIDAYESIKKLAANLINR